MVNLTLHFHVLSGVRDDLAKLNRKASAANLIQISRLGQLLFRRSPA